MKRYKTVISEMFPWLDRDPVMRPREPMLVEDVMDDAQGIEPHETNPRLPDVDGPMHPEPGPDQITAAAEDFIDAMMKLAEQHGYRADHFVKQTPEGISSVRVDFYSGPNDEPAYTCSITVADRDSRQVKFQYSIGTKTYTDPDKFVKSVDIILSSKNSGGRAAKLEEFKKLLKESNFDPRHEFEKQCVLLASMFHLHAPVYTNTDEFKYVSAKITSPAVVSWKGREYPKSHRSSDVQTDDEYELVMDIKNARLTGNIKTTVAGRDGPINQPLQPEIYKIAGDIDQEWSRFFTTVKNQMVEKENDRANRLERAGLTGTLPPSVQEGWFGFGSSKPKLYEPGIDRAMKRAGFSLDKTYAQKEALPSDIPEKIRLGEGDLMLTYVAKGSLPVYIYQNKRSPSKYVYDMFIGGETVAKTKFPDEMIDFINSGNWRAS